MISSFDNAEKSPRNSFRHRRCDGAGLCGTGANMPPVFGKQAVSTILSHDLSHQR
jgi:hypothetical protein